MNASLSGGYAAICGKNDNRDTARDSNPLGSDL